MWGELVFNVDATFIEFDYWLDCISDITVPRRLHLPRHILCIIPLTPFFVRNHICVFLVEHNQTMVVRVSSSSGVSSHPFYTMRTVPAGVTQRGLHTATQDQPNTGDGKNRKRVVLFLTPTLDQHYPQMPMHNRWITWNRVVTLFSFSPKPKWAQFAVIRKTHAHWVLLCVLLCSWKANVYSTNALTTTAPSTVPP